MATTDHLPTILMLIDDIARVSWSEESCCCLLVDVDVDVVVCCPNIACIEFIQALDMVEVGETDEDEANDD